MQNSHLCHVSLSDVMASVENFQVEIPEESVKWKSRMTEAEIAGKIRRMYRSVDLFVQLDC